MREVRIKGVRSKNHFCPFIIIIRDMRHLLTAISYRLHFVEVISIVKGRDTQRKRAKKHQMKIHEIRAHNMYLGTKCCNT